MTSQLQQHIASSQRFKDVRCCTSERQAFPKEHSTFLLGLDASEGRSAKTYVPQVLKHGSSDAASKYLSLLKLLTFRVVLVSLDSCMPTFWNSPLKQDSMQWEDCWNHTTDRHSFISLAEICGFSLNSITTTSFMIANDTGEYSLMQYSVL